MAQRLNNYRFTAVDQQGRQQTGTTAAIHPDAVLGEMERRNWTLIDLRSAPAKLTTHEAEELSAQIATVAAAGLPLETGLAALAEELPNRRLRHALQRLVDELSRGVELETALRETGAPPYVQALARTGIASNTLGKTFESFAQAGESLRSTMPLVMGAVLYALLAAGMCVVVWGVAAVFVIPQFAALYAGFGIEVPALTRWLLALGDFHWGLGLWVLVGALGLALLVAILVGTPVIGAVRSRRWLHRVPGLGTVVRSLALSRFSLLTSTLLDTLDAAKASLGLIVTTGATGVGAAMIVERLN